MDTKTDCRALAAKRSQITSESWSAQAALKTPQFAVLAAAYSIFLIVDITVNAWSVAHLMRPWRGRGAGRQHDEPGGAVQCRRRLAGGVLSRWISAKTLLLFALALMIMGLMALSVAHGIALMLVYAAGIGIGSGLTFFASTILLLDYFGRGPNLELFAMVNLISTIGSVGPAFAGFVADHAGSFVPAFVILEALVLLVLMAVLLDEAARTELPQ